MKNPAIRTIKSFQKNGEFELTTPATYEGVAKKEGFLLAIVALFAFGAVYTGYTSPIAAIVTAFMAFVVGIAISFKPLLAGTLAPAYAILEGAALGCISLWFETAYPGIVVQAVLLTIVVAGVSLFVFSKGFVEVDSKFKEVTTVALGTVLICSVIKLVASVFFGVTFPIFEGGIISIAIDLFIIGVAIASLFVDYQMITDIVDNGLPKEYEWMCAFSLLVTLVWLYLRILEILRDIKK